MQEVKRLEGELSTGKAAALTAIERLKANARELREEAALMRQQVQEDCEEKIVVLNGEVGDVIYLMWCDIISSCFCSCVSFWQLIMCCVICL